MRISLIVVIALCFARDNAMELLDNGMLSDELSKEKEMQFSSESEELSDDLYFHEKMQADDIKKTYSQLLNRLLSNAEARSPRETRRLLREPKNVNEQPTNGRTIKIRHPFKTHLVRRSTEDCLQLSSNKTCRPNRSSELVNERGLCPFTWQDNIKENRIPKIIPEAHCKCQGVKCGTSNSVFPAQCSEITVEIPVVVNNTEVMEKIAIACACLTYPQTTPANTSAPIERHQ